MVNLMLGQSFLQVGLGESGLACARWALAQGATVTILDTRANPPSLQALRESHPDIQLEQSLDALPWPFDKIVMSPGLAPSHPLVLGLLDKAAQAGIEIESELDLFADALQHLADTTQYTPLVFGITGTNGKTTTTRMVECLANFAGKQAVAAGNISPAALHALQEALQAQQLPDVWVLELSSFQLHWTKRLKLDAAVVLNVTQDHLDWHTDMVSYLQDKLNIFAGCKAAVINRDDEALSQAFSKRFPDIPSLSFGLNTPTGSNDFGLMREGGLLWLALAQGDESTVGGRRKKNAEPVTLTIKNLMPSEALQVIGLHNAANGLAALALCHAAGLPMAKLLHGLRAFRGEPHRMEHILTIDGVDYIDDSKGTNVGATVAALHGLSQPVHLVAGGDGKGQDFTPLKPVVAQRCVGVYLIGKDAAQIDQSLQGLTVPVAHFDNLPAAVQAAAKQASAGQCVLLSPACASLDMFKNYAHRAQVFRDAVSELALERGQPC